MTVRRHTPEPLLARIAAANPAEAEAKADTHASANGWCRWIASVDLARISRDQKQGGHFVEGLAVNRVKLYVEGAGGLAFRLAAATALTRGRLLAG